MVQIAIRPARVTDARRLAELRFEFRAAIRPVVETEESFVERCAAWMARQLGANEPWRCWVAERSDRSGEARAIVGHVWIQVIEKIPNPTAELERHAYLTNLYVQPDARGSGAGERLVATVVDWCRERRVDSMILWPTERSRSLYARHGFAVRDDLMEAVLDPGRDLEGTNR